MKTNIATGRSAGHEPRLSERRQARWPLDHPHYHGPSIILYNFRCTLRWVFSVFCTYGKKNWTSSPITCPMWFTQTWLVLCFTLFCSFWLTGESLISAWTYMYSKTFLPIARSHYQFTELWEDLCTWFELFKKTLQNKWRLKFCNSKQ